MANWQRLAYDRSINRSMGIRTTIGTKVTPDSTIQSNLLAYLGQLGPEDQARVVDFARTLTAASQPLVRGVPGKELLRIVGTIPHDELERMKKAVEEECERVDANEW